MQAYDSCFANPVTERNRSWARERDELRHILADPNFHCTERNRRFLKFISEELFAGRHEAIKAYTIAVDVFGRSSSFDPSIDPIVRIEATRLRAALMRYYEHHGRRHSIHIDLPRGRYIPEFVKTGPSANPNPDSRILQIPGGVDLPHRDPAPSRLHPVAVRKWIVGTAGLAGLLLGALLIVASWLEGTGAANLSNRPSIAIQVSPADTDHGGPASALRQALTVALSRFQTLRISSPDRTPERRGNASAGLAASRTSDFLVTLKYDHSDGRPSVWWQLIDHSRGEVLESRMEVSTGDYTSWAGLSGPLIPKMANEIAGRQGVVGRTEAAADSLHPTLGSGCIARARIAIDTSSPAALDVARQCLLATLERRPADADAHASLATVLLALLMENKSGKLAAEALDHANRAVALDPESPNSYYAQMLARYYNGQPDSAILSGRRANALNPFDAVISADLGSILFLTGRWNEGLALISGANRISNRPFAGEILAFDAYRQGSYEEALRRLQSLDTSQSYLGQLLTIATLGNLGRMDLASQNIAALHRSDPHFENNFAEDMAFRSIAPPLVASIKAGLNAAGLQLR